MIAIKRMCLGFAAAVGIAVSLGAATAQADGKVCNNYSTGLWYSIAMNDSTCPGSASDKFRETSWWFVNPGTCFTFWNGSLSGRKFYTYAIAQDGRQWPSGTPNAFVQNWNGSNGVCKAIVDVSCSNAGSNCGLVGHFLNDFTNKTVSLFTDTYSNSR